MKKKLFKILMLLFVMLISFDFLSFAEGKDKIKTKYFDIIYYESNIYEAKYLASFADDMLDKLSAKLQATNKKRIKVYLNDESDVTNGNATNFPFRVINLYTTPPDIEGILANTDEYLKLVFLHELMHVLSLSNNREWDIFSPFMNLYYLYNFIEGVTVSYESLDGFGRVNNPAARHVLIQDLIENRFFSFNKSKGGYDKYPGLTVSYLYGGFFSYYLIQEYGYEKYADLWNGSGRLFYSKFKKIYGISVAQMWEKFKKSMKVKQKVFYNFENLTTAKEFVSNYTKVNDRIYYYDKKSRYLKYININTKPSTNIKNKSRSQKPINVIKLKSSIFDIKPTNNKTKLLIGMYDNTQNEYKKEYFLLDVNSKKIKHLKYDSISNISFISENKFIGQEKAHLYNNVYLYYYDENYKITEKQLLIKNAKTVLFGEFHKFTGDTSHIISNNSDNSNKPNKPNPNSNDNNIFVSLTKINGINKIGFYNFNNGQVSFIEDPGLNHINYLKVQNNIITFGYSNQDFYKFGFIKKNKIYYSDKNYSGGYFGGFIENTKEINNLKTQSNSNTKINMVYQSRFSQHYSISKLNISFSELSYKPITFSKWQKITNTEIYDNDKIISNNISKIDYNISNYYTIIEYLPSILPFAYPRDDSIEFSAVIAGTNRQFTSYYYMYKLYDLYSFNYSNNLYNFSIASQYNKGEFGLNVFKIFPINTNPYNFNLSIISMIGVTAGIIELEIKPQLVANFGFDLSSFTSYYSGNKYFQTGFEFAARATYYQRHNDFIINGNLNLYTPILPFIFGIDYKKDFRSKLNQLNTLEDDNQIWGSNINFDYTKSSNTLISFSSLLFNIEIQYSFLDIFFNRFYASIGAKSSFDENFGYNMTFVEGGIYLDFALANQINAKASFYFGVIYCVEQGSYGFISRIYN